MYNGILHMHSGLRWIVLLSLLIVIYRSATAGQRPFNNTDKRFGLFTTITLDIMLLIGIYLWFMGDWGLKSIQNNGMQNVMKGSTLRFYAIEHPVGMLIAIILAHVGKTFGKKNIPDITKHKRTVLFFGLALLIILVSLPWPFREAGAGRHWF
jgi:hypothetical protein